MSGETGSETDTASGTVIITGTARLPAHVLGPNESRVLELEVVVDPVTMHVERVKTNCLSVLDEELLTELLVGRSVEDDLDDIQRAIQERFFSPKRRAVIAALEDLRKNCREFCSHGRVGGKKANG